MRSGAWLAASSMLTAALAMPLGACSGGYPLPPTRCDEWCNATENFACEEDYDPAGCVSACRRSGPAVGSDDSALGPADGRCEAEFQKLIACYRAAPRTISGTCHYLQQPTCGGPTNDFALCMSVFP